MIYQGANNPIRIWTSAGQDEITNMSVLLHDGSAEVKCWGYSDLTVTDGKIYAPLTESETLKFPDGTLTLEVKWSDADGTVHIEAARTIKVCKRMDTSIISTISENNDTDNTNDDPSDNDLGDTSNTP